MELNIIKPSRTYYSLIHPKMNFDNFIFYMAAAAPTFYRVIFTISCDYEQNVIETGVIKQTNYLNISEGQ